MAKAKTTNIKPAYQMPDDFLNPEEKFWIELENSRALQFEDYLNLCAANPTPDFLAAE